MFFLFFCSLLFFLLKLTARATVLSFASVVLKDNVVSFFHMLNKF